MSNWNNSYIDIDILLYGCLCTTCLFGENTYIVNPRSSCPSYAISYSVISLSAQMLGLLMGNILIAEDPKIMILCATLCNNFAIGLYAGNIRAQFRNKYSLHGSIE